MPRPRHRHARRAPGRRRPRRDARRGRRRRRAAAWNRSPHHLRRERHHAVLGPRARRIMQRPEGAGDVALHEPPVSRLALRVRLQRVEAAALEGDVVGLDAAVAAPRPLAGGEDGDQVRRPEGGAPGPGRGRQRSAGIPPGPGPSVPRPGSARRRGGPGSAPRPPAATRSTGLSPARGARRGSRRGIVSSRPWSCCSEPSNKLGFYSSISGGGPSPGRCHRRGERERALSLLVEVLKSEAVAGTERPRSAIYLRGRCPRNPR